MGLSELLAFKNKAQLNEIATQITDVATQQSIYNNISDGQSIYYPSGTYSNTVKLTVGGKNNFKVVSNRATIKFANLSNGMEFNTCSDFVIDGVIFDGQNSTTKLLKLTECKNVVIKNCTFKNIKAKTETEGFVYGLWLTGCKNITIENCDFINCDGSNSDGLVARFVVVDANSGVSSKYIKIKGCSFNHVFPENDGDAVYFNQPTEQMYATIENCTFIDCAKRSVKAQAQGIKVINNEFIDDVNLYVHDCAIVFFYSNCIAEKNRINFKNSSRGIYIYQDATLSNIKIKDNDISISDAPTNPNTQDGISIGIVNDTVQHANIQVEGNNIYGSNYRYAIFVPYTKYLKLKNNYVENGIVVLGSTNQNTYPSEGFVIEGNVFVKPDNLVLDLRASKAILKNNTFKGITGIYIGSSNTNSNVIITNNVFDSCTTGLEMNKDVTNFYIQSNIFTNTITKDMVIKGSGHIIKDNKLDKGITNATIAECEILTVRTAEGTAAPTVGTWKRGDVVHNTTPTAGSYAGWKCVTTGTPGTWKGFGLIEA